MKNFFSSLKINIKQITLSGMLVAIGIVSDVFLRINNLTFLTMSIFITLGLIFPIHLGIISALLIDTFQLLLRGLIGLWFWALQFEIVLIVMLTFLIKTLLFKFNTKNIQMITISLIAVSLLIAIVVIALNWKQFNLVKITYKGALENNEQFASRIIEKYSSLIGILIIVIISIINMRNFIKNKESESKMIVLSIIIVNILLFDWLFHPIAVRQYFYVKYNLNWTIELFRASVVKGIFKSMLHIFIALMTVPTIYDIYQNHAVSKTQNKYS